MRKILSIFITSSFLALAPLEASADQAAVKAQIEEIAVSLVKQLPLDRKIVLKIAAPEQTGLPKEYLRRLAADFEAAIFKASDFRINLTNRTTTEELWSEAVEFGDAEFEDLYAASRADVALFINAAATQAGLNVNLSAYTLWGDETGKLLASTGAIMLNVNLAKELSFDVEMVGDQLRFLREELASLQQAGGIVENPDTFSEYYYNALKQREMGQRLMAISSLEKAILLNPNFVDPIDDILVLLTAEYGKDGARKYFDARLIGAFSDSLKEYVELSFSDPNDLRQRYEYNSEFMVNGKPLPVVGLWLKINIPILAQKYRDDLSYSGLEFYVFIQSIRSIMIGFNSGELQKYYIDVGRARNELLIEDLQALESEFNRAEYGVFKYQYEGSKNRAYRIFDVGNSLLESAKGAVIIESKDNVPRLIPADMSFALRSGQLVNGPCEMLRRSDYKAAARLNVDAIAKLPPIYEDFVASTVYPIYPFTDRLLYADQCAKDKKFNLNGFGQLLITDDVDVEKPVVLVFQYSDYGFIEIDISTDGTYIMSDGAPISSRGGDFGDAMDVFLDESNKWFFAPGVVQSSIGYAGYTIKELRYTDILGRQKTISSKNIIPRADPYSNPDGRTNSVLNLLETLDLRNFAEKRNAFLGKQANEHASGDFNIDHNVDFKQDIRVALSLVEDVFFNLDDRNRRAVQTILANNQAYTGGIDGKWGPGTEAGVKKILSDWLAMTGNLPNNSAEVIDLFNAIVNGFPEE